MRATIKIKKGIPFTEYSGAATATSYGGGGKVINKRQTAYDTFSNYNNIIERLKKYDKKRK